MKWAWLALVGCSHLDSFGGDIPPLVAFTVEATGDVAPLRPPGVTSEVGLHIAFVWGDQWLTEPFCILPPDTDPRFTDQAAAAIAAGCRDPFGFVPVVVAADTSIALGEPAEIDLFSLPSADLMVGDVTARVAYGSFVVYDDRDGDGTLDLARPHRTPTGGPDGGMGGGGGNDLADSNDVVYGASFVTMTAPDQRVAYREGDFIETAFYPRSGCAAPSPAFSIASAGGFSAADGLASALAGTLPPEDPASCDDSAPADTTVSFGVQAGAAETSCVERTSDSSVRYRQPPDDPPDPTDRTMACAHLPSFDAGDQTSLVQLVVTGRTTDRCKGLTHYTLRGCDETVDCAVPDWDYTASPPPWWPCPVQ
jgi:hypothetical protein